MPRRLTRVLAIVVAAAFVACAERPPRRLAPASIDFSTRGDTVLGEATEAALMRVLAPVAAEEMLRIWGRPPGRTMWMLHVGPNYSATHPETAPWFRTLPRDAPPLARARREFARTLVRKLEPTAGLDDYSWPERRAVYRLRFWQRGDTVLASLPLAATTYCGVQEPWIDGWMTTEVIRFVSVVLVRDAADAWRVLALRTETGGAIGWYGAVRSTCRPMERDTTVAFRSLLAP